MKKNCIKVCCLLLCLILCGCQKEVQQDTSFNESSEAKVQIWYVKNPYSKEDLIQEELAIYKRTLSNKELLDVTNFESWQAMADAIKEKGMPDILLMDDWYGTSTNSSYYAEAMDVDIVAIQQLIEDNQILDVSELLVADESYVANNYFAAVMDAGKIDGKQYVLPISMKTDYLLTDKEKKETTHLADLGEVYSIEELLNVVSLDAEMYKNEDFYWTLVPTSSQSVYDLGSWIGNFLQSTGYVEWNALTGEVTIEKESFKQAIEYVKLAISQRNEVYNGAHKTELQALSFADFREAYLFEMANMNMPFTSRYYMSAYAQLANMELKLYPYPYLGNPDETGVYINLFAVIGAESEQQEAAYRVIRDLMDLSADEWDNINTDSALAWVTSVNKNVLQQQIEKLGEEAGNQYKYGNASFKGEGLNSDLSSQLLSWSEKIMHANLSNPELAGLIEMNFVSYILEDNASFDFDDTFEKFANAMNATVR